MKILMLTSSYPTKDNLSSGPFIQNIARALKSKDIDVSVLVFAPSGKLNEYYDEAGIHIIEYPYSLIFPPALHRYNGLIPTIRKSFFAKIELPFYFFSSLYYLYKYSKNCDIVHAQWFIPSGFIAAVNKLLIKKPLVTTAWGAEFHLPPNALIKLLYSFVIHQSNRITTVSKYMNDLSKKYFRQSLKIIPNGVNLNEFKPKRIKRDSKKIVIGAIRRLVPEKRLEDLIMAIGLLSDGDRNKITVQIIGSGPEESKLKSLVGKLSLEKIIQFLGNISHEHISQYLNGMDIIVNPSIQEGLATANLEAMACGKPLIATNFCGNNELILNGKIGLLYKPKSSKDLSKKIQDLINNKIVREKLGKNARKRIEKEFSIDIISDKYLQVYKSLL